MLFWTPILEYIKIRPSPISKLSPDALIKVQVSQWFDGEWTTYGLATDQSKPTVSHFSYAPLINCKITRKGNTIFIV